MKNFDFITVGGATRDVSFFTDQGVLIKNKRDILRQELLAFEYGSKIKVDRFHYNYGGGATNAAVCLSKLSLKTACLTSVGADEAGRLIVDNLRQNKIETSLIQINKQTESGTSFILIAPTGERIIFGSRGANSYLQITSKHGSIFNKTANIYLASLSGKWLKNLQQLFVSVTTNGPKVYWNPGGAQIRVGVNKLAPFLKKTEVFMLNQDEAIEFVLTSPNHEKLNHKFLNNVDNLLPIIHSFGPKIVMITLGKGGAVAYDGQKFYRRNILKDKNRIDTTGIGDIFNSSFAAGHSQYHDINKSLSLALKNAAAKISRLGAQNGLLKINLKK